VRSTKPKRQGNRSPSICGQRGGAGVDQGENRAAVVGVGEGKKEKYKRSQLIERGKKIIPEYEQSYIFYAEKFVIHHLKKKVPEKTGHLLWGGMTLGLGPEEYGLVIHIGEKRMIFTFTKNELIKGYGNREWKNRLLARIDEILNKIQG